MEDYITAKVAAQLLSEKLGREIKAAYIYKIKNVRKIEIDSHLFLYHREDIMAANIREHKQSSPEKLEERREFTRQWKRDNPDKVRDYNRRQYLKRKGESHE